MRTARTDELTDDEITAIRDLMIISFSTSFTVHDWNNSVGGVHIFIEEDGVPVSHASVVTRELLAGETRLNTGYVEAVATHPDRRRQGLGSAVMAAVGDHIRWTYELGALSTGEQEFYARLGWEVWQGPTFVRRGDALERTADEDGGIMILRTPTTPVFDSDGPISCEWRPGDVW